MVGKFLQQDPVGIASGPDTSEFVRSSPATFVDPTGLKGVPPPAPAGKKVVSPASTAASSHGVHVFTTPHVLSSSPARRTYGPWTLTNIQFGASSTRWWVTYTFERTVTDEVDMEESWSVTVVPRWLIDDDAADKLRDTLFRQDYRIGTDFGKADRTTAAWSIEVLWSAAASHTKSPAILVNLEVALLGLAEALELNNEYYVLQKCTTTWAQPVHTRITPRNGRRRPCGLKSCTSLSVGRSAQDFSSLWRTSMAARRRAPEEQLGAIQSGADETGHSSCGPSISIRMRWFAWRELTLATSSAAERIALLVFMSATLLGGMATRGPNGDMFSGSSGRGISVVVCADAGPSTWRQVRLMSGRSGRLPRCVPVPLDDFAESSAPEQRGRAASQFERGFSFEISASGPCQIGGRGPRERGARVGAGP